MRIPIHPPMVPMQEYVLFVDLSQSIHNPKQTEIWLTPWVLEGNCNTMDAISALHRTTMYDQACTRMMGRRIKYPLKRDRKQIALEGGV